MRTGAGSAHDARKKNFRLEFFAQNGHTPAVTRKKREAVSDRCSEKDDKRFRRFPGRPRAGAHVWGKGARILTEINRLPHLTRKSPA
jgi:hypothetical protein